MGQKRFQTNYRNSPTTTGIAPHYPIQFKDLLYKKELEIRSREVGGGGEVDTTKRWIDL